MDPTHFEASWYTRYLFHEKNTIFDNSFTVWINLAMSVHLGKQCRTDTNLVDVDSIIWLITYLS